MTIDPQNGLINRRFGPYILLSEIGCGAMAQVYLGALPCAPKRMRFVALKCMHQAYQTNPDYVRLFYHEAEIALGLMHPNLVETWSCGVVQGRHTIVMDYLPGVSIGSLLSRGAIPIEVALWIAINILNGLSYLHEKTDDMGNPLGIVHRDLTPDNVIVGFDGTVRILDFGVSKCGVDVDDIQKGMMVGKYAYMSPEQCRGCNIDARSDVFSAAAVLYEMCTGHPAFARDTDIATIEALLNDEIVPPNRESWRFPSFLSQCIMQGLARNPDRRFHSARAFADELATFVKLQGMSDTQRKCQAHIAHVCRDLIDSESNRMATATMAMQPYMPSIDDLISQGSSQPPDFTNNAFVLGEVTFSKL